MNAVAELLGAGDPARAALVCDRHEITYAQLSARVARAAGRLRSIGVGPGERVLLAADDGIEWVVAHLATMWAAAVSVPLNPRLFPDRLAQIARESGARLLLCDRLHGSGIHELPIAQLSAADAIDAVAVDAQTPAFWAYSSGTTSQPKAVVHGHRALAGCAAFARDVLQAGAQDRFYSSSKLFFAYPLANSLYAGLGLGASVIVDPRWPDAAATLASLTELQATVLLSVPSFYHALLRSGRSACLRGSLQLRCVSAGEALPDRIADDWRTETGLGIVSGYGMSESLALVLYRDARRDSYARAAPLAQVRADAAEHPAAAHRLWFRHPSVALGYHCRPELERENFRDGWCSTGDLFHEPAAGQYAFAGRADDWVKVSGRWIGVLELEAQLVRECRDGIRDLAVAAVTGADDLSAIAVFAVAGAAGPESARSMLGGAAARLPTYQKPRWVHWVDGLPRTATGKLARAALQTLHLQCMKQHRTEEGA